MNQKYKTKLDQREVENEEKEKREKKQTLWTSPFSLDWESEGEREEREKKADGPRGLITLSRQPALHDSAIAPETLAQQCGAHATLASVNDATLAHVARQSDTVARWRNQKSQFCKYFFYWY
jgi:hypothetical protein